MNTRKTLNSLNQLNRTMVGAVRLAEETAYGFLDKVVRGIERPKSSTAIHSRRQLHFMAQACGRGEHLVKQNPNFRAAMWLLSR